DCADNVIPFPNATGKDQYCKHNVDSVAASSVKAEEKPSSDEDVKGFDVDSIKVDQTKLFNLILVWLSIIFN
ncbi:skp1-like protein 1a, partial [Phtheirospermum japonicum]